MKRPTKQEIREAVEKLKSKSEGSAPPPEPSVGKLTEKKSSQRIRKQGV
ncbi:MAG: hypothetical protein KF884_04950 [Fimbriimonadaceae bacterium]|nr:hypothetical protein [Fimbriimonadaceae bacterium]QYK59434.1 MAG: hypothetical protein KF884_04950 [Fimbriimonadaceae bacterium]